MIYLKLSMMKYLKTWSVLFATLLSVGAFAQQAQSVMLPNGWRLTPAGKHLPLGDLPLNIAQRAVAGRDQQRLRPSMRQGV